MPNGDSHPPAGGTLWTAIADAAKNWPVEKLTLLALVAVLLVQEEMNQRQDERSTEAMRAILLECVKGRAGDGQTDRTRGGPVPYEASDRATGDRGLSSR